MKSLYSAQGSTPNTNKHHRKHLFKKQILSILSLFALFAFLLSTTPQYHTKPPLKFNAQQQCLPAYPVL
jgi:hypothetical protein